jgi:hypothetical protein
LKLEAPTPRGDESKQKVVRVCSGKPILTLWGSSHLAPHRGLGLNVEDGLRSSFHRMINLSKGGMKLTSQLTDEIVTAIRSHPGHKQVYVFLLGGHNNQTNSGSRKGCLVLPQDHDRGSKGRNQGLALQNNP